MSLYFEDLEVGDAVPLGSVTAEREEMVGFAERYDPQPMHTDSGAGSGDTLTASGLFTASLLMRLLVEEFLQETEAKGAVGAESIRWRTPVRPGDELSADVEIVEKEPWHGDATGGLAHCQITATNQTGAEAISMVGLVLFERREEAT